MVSMQKNSIQPLSKLAVPLKSKGRFFKENKTHLRTDFQRDRDRIIHSTAFRRLKHKTQVFVNTSGDHFRTRITHSLEVSQIARTLSKFFNLNEDLCETLSLAHDLGHTPFGHAGENVLNNCMKKYGGFDDRLEKDDILFDHTVIDKISLDIISGSTVDFKKELIGDSFVINNPKASASCGCGLSFSV